MVYLPVGFTRGGRVADVSIDEDFQFGQIHFIHEGIMRGS
jgi:hypothetical protein